MTTKIEWTDEVWNPVTGCSKVSQGCKNCYAERIAERFWKDRKFTDVRCHRERLKIPVRWKKPRMIFVNSMSDLFHEEIKDHFIDDVFTVMAVCSRHTFQILTKCPKRMSQYIAGIKYDYHENPVGSNNRWQSGDTWRNLTYKLDNVWLGVSVENQQTADERIPWLLKTPAVVRFVSYEPALGPVDLSRVNDVIGSMPILGGIDWIIAGCESGPNRRPANPDWFRSIRDQCQEAGIPFFLKQMEVNGKIVKMPELDGRVWNEYPEVK